MSLSYREKIRKLLALAESPEEEEAKAALLKARELMAEHKLSEADLNEAKNQKVKEVQTTISCSKKREPWIIELSAVIGENYCCQAFRNHFPRQQTQYVGFIGLEDDVDLCQEVFRYAVNYVRTAIKHIKKAHVNYPTAYVTELSNSYGYGFAKGVKQAFAAQQQEYQSVGLALTVPKEVREATQDFGQKAFRAKAQERLHVGSYRQGYDEGKEFSPTKVLKGSAV